jgi:hypothetical protein
LEVEPINFHFSPSTPSRGSGIVCVGTDVADTDRRPDEGHLEFGVTNNTKEHNMAYRCEAQSPEAVVQLIAASYLRHGFYWYVTGSIPTDKDPALIDRKLIAKYGIDVSEWERRHRKQRGVANAHYLRYQQWFILLVSEGHHALKQPAGKGGEGEHLRDCRRTPIRFNGYSISYRRSGVTPAGGPTAKWHAHVRIDDNSYRILKDRFIDLATHRTADTLGHEFGRIPFARYAPIRRQLLNILRAVNERRKQQSFELLPHNVLKLKRTPVTVYVRPETDVQSNQTRAEAA